MIKSRIMRWAGHVARMGELRNTDDILVRRPKGRDHSENLDIVGKIILGMDLREIGWGNVDWMH
jgi:hypothetical protein